MAQIHSYLNLLPIASIHLFHLYYRNEKGEWALIIATERGVYRYLNEVIFLVMG